MAFRGENDALRARVEQLERDLADARRRHGSAAPSEGGAAEALLGGPLAISRSLDLEGELDEDGFELAVERLRTAYLSVGEVSRVGRTFTWSLAPGRNATRSVDVTIVARNGRTRIRIVEKLGQLAGGLFGGIVGGVGGGGIALPILPAMLGDMPWLTLVTVPAWIGGVWVAVRAAFGATARSRARTMDTLVADLEEDLRAHLASLPAAHAARVRVQNERAEAEAEVERPERRERNGA